MPDFVESLRTFRNTPLTFFGGFLSNELLISCVIESSCKTQEWSGIKPDWESENKSFWTKSLKRALNISNSNFLLNVGGRFISLEFFKKFWHSFQWTGTMSPFFQFYREITADEDDSNRYFKVFTIDIPHSCIKRMETLSIHVLCSNLKCLL